MDTKLMELHETENVVAMAAAASALLAEVIDHGAADAMTERAHRVIALLLVHAERAKALCAESIKSALSD